MYSLKLYILSGSEFNSNQSDFYSISLALTSAHTVISSIAINTLHGQNQHFSLPKTIQTQV